jgi:serine/threonine-protein kinase RsbW
MPKTKKVKTIRLSIDSDLDQVFHIGQAVKALCSNTPLTNYEIYDVELCIVETVNNAIKHAYNLEHGNVVELIIDINTDHIRFQVCDTGNSMDCIPDPDINMNLDSIETLPEKGFGLLLVQRLMDSISYKSCAGKNTLTMVKFFNKISLNP